MRRLFAALGIVGLTSVVQVNVACAEGRSATVVPPQPAAASADAKFILTLSACARRRTSDGGMVCIPLNNARLEARLREQASTSNYHESVLDSGIPPAAASSTAETSAPAVDAKQVEAQPSGVESYREGFDLTVKPLYESDGVLYAQYDIVAEQVTGWAYAANEGAVARRRPVVQRTHVFGTTRLRVGESATLERNGYSFVLAYAQKGGAAYVGGL